MRRTLIFGMASLALLGGCQREPEASGPRSPGRFAGIGVFDAGKLWSQMTAAKPTGDPAAARLADDEHIIVVLDSHTGEVRECGDHSGYCVAMNPWSGPTGALPVRPAKHAADLAVEDDARGEGG